MNLKRTRLLNNAEVKKGTVVYWMSRDMRVEDNWALIFANEISEKENSPLVVFFCLAPNFLEATIRQYDFLLHGLQQVEQKLTELEIPFFLLKGKPEKQIPLFLKEINAGKLISDFDPLKIKIQWKNLILKKINIPFYEVDAHNIVPAFFVSQKEEFAAYTIRPKIKKALPEFLEEFPGIKKRKRNFSIKAPSINWQNLESTLKIDFSVPKINQIKPGTNEADETLKKFIFRKLEMYSYERNNPLKDAQSNLSPYLHFGQISAQRIALQIEKHVPETKSKDAFLEELIIRRELADNFCLYNTNYDSFEGFQPWAKKTLNEHRKDKREFLYSLKEFEDAKTHEDLWNAAQMELKTKGKMNGFMRMYWAKKILEWSNSPEEALSIAIFLNDKYELDGRDPNGYVGCAWAIGGVHDRAWQERDVFGKIRFMNLNGCKRKFDVDEYIEKNLG
jgi:deoxyribodipyrimidine photo-lyase